MPLSAGKKIFGSSSHLDWQINVMQNSHPRKLNIETWQAMRPLIRAKTDISFALPFRKSISSNGSVIIHAAKGDIHISPKGLITSGSINEANLIEVSIADLVNQVYPNNLSEIQLTNLHDAMRCKYDLGCAPGYFRRSRNALIAEILRCLPEPNRRFAQYLGIAYVSEPNDLINIIAKHIKTLERVYLDDKRVLCLVVEFIKSMEGDGRKKSALKRRAILKDPNKVVFNIKQFLLESGLRECGWRHLLKIDHIQRTIWSKYLFRTEINTFNGELDLFVLTLNIVSLNFPKVALYAPDQLQIYFRRGNDDDVKFQFITKIALTEIEKSKKTGRLSIKKITSVMRGLRDLYDFVNTGMNEAPPKGAGIEWLRRKSAIWHEEIATRERANLGENIDWSNRFSENLLHITQDHYVATMLTSTDAFFIESRLMHHCVSSRWEIALLDECIIYHLFDASTGEMATLDLREDKSLRKWEPYECRSVFNSNISLRMSDFVKELIERVNHFVRK